MKEYEVQRKYVSWETQTVLAESYEDAIDKAQEAGTWSEVWDASEATEDYWIKDIDAMEVKTMLEADNYTWKDSI